MGFFCGQQGSVGTSEKLYGTPFDGQNNATTLHLHPPPPPPPPKDVYVPISGTCEHVVLRSKEEFRLHVQLSLLII